MRDLKDHRHLLVRDSSTARLRSSEVDSDSRQTWIFSSLASSIDAACAGHGYAWYPEDRIRRALDAGLLKALPLRAGRERFIDIYLVIADPERAGPGSRRLAQLLMEATQARR